MESMAIPLLREPPLTPPADLGPFRRRDYDALPDEPRCELIFGRFYLSPSPSPLHQIVLFALWQHLDQICATAGGLVVGAPLDVALADHSVVQPDLLYFTPARRGLVRGRIEGAPDLAIEILSSGTARRDRGEKLALYAGSAVREYWIVDPIERQIEFMENEAGRFMMVLPEGGEYRSRTLPEIYLDLTAFWREVAVRLPIEP
jgi:Uma2 family endonuclease